MRRKYFSPKLTSAQMPSGSDLLARIADTGVAERLAASIAVRRGISMLAARQIILDSANRTANRLH